MGIVVGIIGVLIGVTVAGSVIWAKHLAETRKDKNYERALKMVPLLIHLPPETDDIQAGGRDERDVTNEEISEAQIMYTTIASVVQKGLKTRIYGQKHIAFEVVATGGLVKYRTLVPIELLETVKQAVVSAYPTARLEETREDSIFSPDTTNAGVAGGTLSLKKDYVYPIATYEDTKWDASGSILNAMSKVKDDEGMALQILIRPTDGGWTRKSKERVQNIKDGKKNFKDDALGGTLDYIRQIFTALWKAPEESRGQGEEKQLTSLQQEEIQVIENKTKYPGFETLIRVVASSGTQARSEALLSGMVAAFSQFDSPANNGFRYEPARDIEELTEHYIYRIFPQGNREMILNSIEMASIFHLPSQSSIPTSQVERQAMKQVDGPAKLVQEGVLIGVNYFRGEQKEIRLSVDDRRRHTYVIGSTGMGKSVFLRNIAYQDMMDGRGFAFIDPHGDVAEELLSMVPEERIDDVIYFDPGDMENPIGMNMFEYETEDQKDFIVQEGINMLYSLYDPGHTGIFGPRGEHMFRNAALLLMSDPKGATFIDIPKVFTDPEYVKDKLKYVTDKSVYDYWTKEFPASQKSNDAGEVITWLVSKWGPFLSNTMMRNILGQSKSGFNIREVMDNNKILLVNLSKGKMGELNSKLLGMIFVMKFQAAAMARVDIPEDQRKDFCLFVDEFQNFSTDSFESILSEARKFRLNLVVANQFMTQLTDKIREGVLGNVGTIVAGRLGVTDAELMEKVFTPVFNAEDLHKTPNHNAIATVMMFGMPSRPFTMTWPKLGEENPGVMDSLKKYSAVKYGKTRAEVDKEINARWENAGGSVKKAIGDNEGTGDAPKTDFLDEWLNKQKQSGNKPVEAPEKPVEANKDKKVSDETGKDETFVKLR